MSERSARAYIGENSLTVLPCGQPLAVYSSSSQSLSTDIFELSRGSRSSDSGITRTHLALTFSQSFATKSKSRLSVPGVSPNFDSSLHVGHLASQTNVLVRDRSDKWLNDSDQKQDTTRGKTETKESKAN